jgi:putative chitinase
MHLDVVSRAAITCERLAAFAPIPLERARLMARELEAGRYDAGLTSPLRVAHFMAQLHHESAGFSRLEESFAYKPERLDAMFSAVKDEDDAKALLAKGPQAVANRVYGGRLGNVEPDDGWRYRGRGLIQLTGRANYAKACEWASRDLLDNPDQAADPVIACKIALAYWRWKALNDEADRDDLEAVTRAVNGPALAGILDRRKQLARAKQIWRPV